MTNMVETLCYKKILYITDTAVYAQVWMEEDATNMASWSSE
jgi:hypothetical protein